jgi:hypothetical protein
MDLEEEKLAIAEIDGTLCESMISSNECFSREINKFLKSKKTSVEEIYIETYNDPISITEALMLILEEGFVNFTDITEKIQYLIASGYDKNLILEDIETWKEDSESPKKEFIYNEVLRLISSGGD